MKIDHMVASRIACVRISRHTFSSRESRGGFTLIELLVSTALVVLIMSLFAQIFALATTSMRDQRSIARHDQRVRVIETQFRQDLEAMTYRQIVNATDLATGIVPLHPDHPVDEERQRGYFYYSENNPADQTDDVLQFTADLVVNRRSGSTSSTTAPTKFVGRTAQNVTGSLDEIAGDDGRPDVPRVASRAAEISYFMRGGSLYRRTMLLRDPPQDPLRRGQPTNDPGLGALTGPMFGATRGLDTMPAAMRLPANFLPAEFSTTQNFFGAFDLSATRYQYILGADTITPAANASALFVHTTDSLSNLAAERPLGQPWNRFGHFPRAPVDRRVSDMENFYPAAGQPFEYLRSSNGRPASGQFIGRFTHGETSHSSFVWPGVAENAAAPFSPMSRVDLQLKADPTNANLADGTIGDAAVAADRLIGSRFAEDLVMSNVVGFDVKIWDDFAQQFVDLGGGTTGIYGAGSAALSKNNAALGSGFFGFAYGPGIDGTDASRISTVANNIFDTWHPAIDGMTNVDTNGNGTFDDGTSVFADGERNVFDGVFDPPPTWATQANVNSPIDNNTGNGVAGLGQISSGQNSVVDFEGVWDTNQIYQTGDLVRPDLNYPPYARSATDSRLANMLFRVEVFDLDSDGSVATDANTPTAQQPDWWQAIEHGQVKYLTASGDVMIWRPVYRDVRIGLKKLAIVVTVRDPKSNTLREMTVVHSFVENG